MGGTKRMLPLDIIIVLMCLILLGEPLRKLAAYVARPFRRFDILQILILDVFLAGFLLYVLALIPMGFFRLQAFIILLVISVAVVVDNLVRKIAKFTIRDICALCRIRYSEFLVSAACVFLVFVSVLAIELMSLSNIVLGSIYDTSLHSLFTQLISEHGYIPATHGPYLASALIYPQGASVVFAFASVLLDMVSAKAVLNVTALFIALSTLGGYFLGKEISDKPYFGAILAFSTGFVATHPRYLTWGGNNFVVAFPLFMICVGLHFSHAEEPKKTKYEVVIEGLLLGYLATAYLPAFFVVALLFLFEAIIESLRDWDTASYSAKQYLLLICSGIVVILPNVLRYGSFYAFPSHNTGIPSDAKIDISSFGCYPPPLWAIDQILHERFPLNVTILFLMLLGVVALVIAKKSSFEKKLITIAAGACVIPEIILFFETRFLELRMIAGVCLCVIPFVSVNLLIAFSVYYVASTYAQRPSSKRDDTKKKQLTDLKRNDVFAVSALILIILSPFVFNAFSVDEKLLSGYYSYAMTSQDDYSMLLWMKDNLNKTSSKILVNPDDSGNFVPSVSNLACVYPYSAHQLSTSYLDVVHSLHLGRLDLPEYDFMKYHNITHIFIGSKAVSWEIGDHDWNAEFFIDNPNFELVKNIGNSYLFKVRYIRSEEVFQDAFEYANLTENRWRIYVPPELSEAGSGEAVCCEECEGNASLRITAQRDENRSYYWYSIYKGVHIGKYDFPFDIKLRFHVKLASGFSQNDGLLVIVSSPDWKQQAYLVTARNAAINQELLFTVNPDGLSEFNLSEIWRSLHGMPPPNDFYLQIANYDMDCIKNVAYVSDISISLDIP